MQRLGRVLHISPSGNIIIKVEKTPKIGDTVVDENLKPVGRVFDIIGPLSAPYVTVKPTIKETEKIKNKLVYALPSSRRKERFKS